MKPEYYFILKPGCLDSNSVYATYQLYGSEQGISLFEAHPSHL
jgi:hypothetical protein